MRNLNSADIEFLKNLQHEMLTQDKVCQASPRFWVVAQYEKIPTSEDSADGSILVCDDGHEYGEDVKEAINLLLEDHPEEIPSIYFFEQCNNFFDVIYVLERLGISGFRQVFYEKIHTVQRNTFFLTLRECKEHIQKNHYHYNQTVHSYAMTAWRSPQVEQLYEILENVDFSQLKEPGQDEV